MVKIYVQSPKIMKATCFAQIKRSDKDNRPDKRHRSCAAARSEKQRRPTKTSSDERKNLSHILAP